MTKAASSQCQNPNPRLCQRSMSKRSGRALKHPSMLRRKSPKRLQPSRIVFDKRCAWPLKKLLRGARSIISSIMVTKRKLLLARTISRGTALCLILAGLFVIGCGRPSSPDSAAPVPPASENNAREVGVVLRAAPNPVPGGTETGTTTITWQTGSESAADIYYFNGKDETLFASGPRGSKEATFIRPGSNEFRLYNQGERKLVTQLIVTMPTPAASVSGTPATPAASTNQ